MILSVASIIIVITQLGIGLGLEFVERTEIREMRKKIDDALDNEYKEKARTFLMTTQTAKEKFDTEAVGKGISELGEAYRYKQTASIILKVLRKLVSDIMRLIVMIVALAIALALMGWEDVYAGYNFLPFIALAFLILFTCVLMINSRIGNYTSFRSKFYDLSEKPLLSEAQQIIKKLEDEQLI
jgi:hypothetical protein